MKATQVRVTPSLPMYVCLVCGKAIGAFYGRHADVNERNAVGTCSKVCEQKYERLP